MFGTEKSELVKVILADSMSKDEAIEKEQLEIEKVRFCALAMSLRLRI